MTLKAYNILIITITSASMLLVSAISVVVDPGAIYLRKYLTNSEFDLYATTVVTTEHGMIVDGWNERSTKLALAKSAGQFDCAILGSSHIMGVSSHRRPSTVQGYCDRLINLGVSGAGVEDLVVFIYTMASEHQLPRRVFIGIDPWTLTFNADPRWRENETVYQEGLEAFKTDDRQLYESYWSKIATNLINADYFHEALLVVQKRGIRQVFKEYRFSVRNSRALESERLSPLIVKSFDYASGYSLPVMLPDGSHVYPAEHIEMARAHRLLLTDDGYNIREGLSYDEDACQLVIRMTTYLKKMGVDVYFVLTPYHYNVWKGSGPTRRVMAAVSAKVRQLGREHGIPMLGSFNPVELGCTEDEFYDFMHPTQSCLSKAFSKRD